MGRTHQMCGTHTKTGVERWWGKKNQVGIVGMQQAGSEQGPNNEHIPVCRKNREQVTMVERTMCWGRQVWAGRGTRKRWWHHAILCRTGRDQ